MKTNKQPQEGDLRVWWIPQVPMDAFTHRVRNVDEGMQLLSALAYYDTFQLENNIKPDFCNAGGLSIFEGGEWVDWCDEDGNDIDSTELYKL